MAFIGAGNFARAVLLPRFVKAKDAELIGLCTATGVAARSTGEKFGFRYCTTDAARLLEDESVAAVVIATRHGSHARFAADALRAGKAVFVEKPLAINEEQLAGVLEAQAETGGLLTVGFNRRFSPLSARLKEVYSTRFPWTPLWGRRGGPEEIGGVLTERQLNGSGELPERWSAKRKTEIVLRLLRGEERGVNEHLIVEPPLGYLRHDFIHEDRKGLTAWIMKHVAYARREAAELRKAREAVAQEEIPARLFGTQAERKRWIRAKVWNRLPPLLRPWLYFFYRLVLRGGWLDGPVAVAYHFLHALWFPMLIDLYDLADRRNLRAEPECGRCAESRGLVEHLSGPRGRSGGVEVSLIRDSQNP